MANIKVFVHTTDTDAEGTAMTLGPWTCLSRLAKNILKHAQAKAKFTPKAVLLYVLICQ